MSSFDEDWGSKGPPDGRLKRTAEIVAMSLVVALAAVVGLFALLNFAIDRRADSRIASDEAWLEQSLGRQLDVLRSVAVDMARIPEPPAGGLSVVQASWRLQSRLHPELVDAAWYDRSGLRLHALAFGSRPKLVASAIEIPTTSPGNSSLEAVRQDRERLLGDFIIQTGKSGGVFALTVSLSGLLARSIPPGIAELYTVSIESVAADLPKLENDASDAVPRTRFASQLAPPYSNLQIAFVPKAGSFAFSGYLGPAAIAGGTFLSILMVLLLRHQLRERKRADARLQSEIAFRHSMEASLTIGLRAKDHDGKVLFVNPAFCRMIGYRATELVGHYPPMPYWLEDIHSEVLRRQETSDRPAPQSFETRFRRSDGAIINVQVYEAPLIDASGMHRGWMGSLIDITDQKRASEQARVHVQSLQQTGRLVTMGEMASMIAHELNQPLSAIASYAAGSLNLLRSGKTEVEVLAPGLEKLADQVERAGKIIRRIQDFTRKREPSLAPLQLASVVNETCNLLYSDARAHGLRIITNTDAELSQVLGDPILIEQLLVNL